MRARLLGTLLAAAPACGLLAQPMATVEPAIDPARAQQLVRMVRQDCGSCHGMRLTGGLGPALTRQALADMPLETLVATIVHGRPGTPMPGWKRLLSAADAGWIARQLQAGFPPQGQVQQ